MTALDDVTAIFVTFNSADVIAQALDSVPATMPVIVIDNASGDDTLAIVRAKRPNVVILANAENIGYGAALNKAAGRATTEFVLMLNPDVIVSGAAVVALRRAADEFTRSFLFGPAMVNPAGVAAKPPRDPLFHPSHPLFKPFVNVRRHDQRLPSSAKRVGWIVGAAIFARRQALLDAGGFDEKIFLFFEETDLCYRAVMSGRPPVWVPEAVVLNLEGSSCGSATVPRAYFREWHYAWSQYYLARKYGSGLRFTDTVVRPAVLWLKLTFYRLAHDDLKAAYYAGRFNGAIASLQGRHSKRRLSSWGSSVADDAGADIAKMQVE